MNLDLFEATELSAAPEFPVTFKPSETPDARAMRRIKTVLRNGHPAVLAFSAGKDSTALVSLALLSAREMVEQGEACPPIVVLNSDTLVESPGVHELARNELKKMQRYADRHRIPLSIKVGVPLLNDTFVVRVIGGRALPSFPSGNTDCATDWKVNVSDRSIKQVFKQLGTTHWGEPVVMTGVRSNESAVRDQRIAGRGEKADEIWRNEKGKLRLSPILDFREEDVWEHIGYAAAGLIDSYSDFENTMDLYREAGGDSCVIVADMKGAAKSKPCGVRTGCWVCTRVKEDSSMQQMILSDPIKNGFLQPLADLRDFISRTQYDWSLRHYVWRTIDDDGYITISPDAYSPDMLARLLRYTLAAQLKSKVQIISPAQLIAIDARWSQYALHPPFTAIKIFNEVYDAAMNGYYELAPKVPRYPPTPKIPLGKIKVGFPTYRDATKGYVTGIRDVAAELFTDRFKTLSTGEVVIDYEPQKPNSSDELVAADDSDIDVDEQAAADFLGILADDYIKEYCHHDCTDWTWGFRTYLRIGTIELPKGGTRMAHEIVQRSQWRQQHDLHGQQSPDALLERCDIKFASQLELI